MLLESTTGTIAPLQSKKESLQAEQVVPETRLSLSHEGIYAADDWRTLDHDRASKL